jgi:two-component sensor histidine kinase
MHHRVKNNLNMISSIINMERNRVPGTETDRILSNIQNRIKAIGLIHQNLYTGKHIDRVSVKTYCEELIRQIQLSFSPALIQIEKSIEDMDLPIHLALPCGLLLTELLTNALKYAFPEKRTGKIFIQFKKISSSAKEPYVELLVKDNGIGLPKHVSWKNPESMGFRLIHALSQQLHGTLRIQSKHGTECGIRFPLKTKPK